MGPPYRCIVTFFEDFEAPGGLQNHQKSLKIEYQNLMIFWNASWKASWTILEAKVKSKPSKMRAKMVPTERNRALQKVTDFSMKKSRKHPRKSVPQTKM